MEDPVLIQLVHTVWQHVLSSPPTSRSSSTDSSLRIVSFLNANNLLNFFIWLILHSGHQHPKEISKEMAFLGSIACDRSSPITQDTREKRSGMTKSKKLFKGRRRKRALVASAEGLFGLRGAFSKDSNSKIRREADPRCIGQNAPDLRRV